MKSHPCRTARVAVVGIDGFSPVHMDRYVQAGQLPAIAEVVRQGASAPLVSTLPATTPVAWATVLTGAPPSVTGISGFLLHQPGKFLNQRVSGCYSHRCHAQQIWSRVTESGKRAYVVKFPISYPSRTATLRIDGAAGWGGLKCFHEVASASVATTDSSANCTRIEPDETRWASEELLQGDVVWRGIWRIANLWSNEHVTLHVAVRRTPDAIGSVAIALQPDTASVVALLAPGEWSEPITLTAVGRRGPANCCFRVKLLSCSIDPAAVRLLNTTLHERNGIAEPDWIWQQYSERVGPIEEQTEPSLVFRCGLDLETQIELFRLNAQWLERACSELLQGEAWDLFMVQIHIVDWAHHLLHGKIDSRHPDYDVADAEKYESLLLEVYRMADDLVAKVARIVGPTANLIVLGDHGQDLQHSVFRANEWLAREGFLVWDGDGVEVDWSQTRAYATGNYIHLNLEGREPGGIVAAGDAQRVQEAIVAGLLMITDPRTQSRVVRIAGEKRDFERLGAGGALMGDIIFCLTSGYQATNGRGAVLSTTVALKEFTSGHDHFWPLDPRIHTRIFASGPSFRVGHLHSRAEHLVDVAPTICAAIGIDPPAESQGHTIEDLFYRDGDERGRAYAGVTPETGELVEPAGIV
jgi:predicted AlkP superfamily phosphohydrolase/phosphomutase